MKHMRALSTFSFVVVSSIVSAQVSMPATTIADLQLLQALVDRNADPHKLIAAAQGDYPVALVNGRASVGFLAKLGDTFDPSNTTSEHVHIGSRIGDVLSLRVDAYHLDALNAIPGLLYAELAGVVAPNLDRVVRATHADSVQQGINLPQTYTGRNVLIGITDWGFDYTHPMFYDTTLTTSRVRAAWDQFRQVGPGPAAFSYGAEFDTPSELMTAQADTANIYSYATHGSHVAGIAGGGGAGTIYRGMAFDAQYLFCTFLVDAAAVLDAYAWMKAIADQDQKRLVVNMSWGLYWMGTLDGNSLISQAIDQYSLDGVVFCNSGGNNGDINFHLKRDFTGDTLRSRIEFYPYSAHPKMWGQSITMWGEEGESFKSGFYVVDATNQTVAQTPWYNTTDQQPYLDSLMVIGTDTVFFNLTAEAAHPLNGRPHFRVRVKNTSAALRIALMSTATQGRVHFWNVTELSNDVGNWGMNFMSGGPGGIWTNGDKQYGISEPACTESLITVAAYSSEYFLSGGIVTGGAIATFSSFGPTMDERMKPDITAPGVSVGSSISSFTDNNFSAILTVPFQGSDYPFARFSGTSMSSPAVTGIVALLLEADPTLTAAEVKDLIKTTARTDIHTGTIPTGGSTRWGMGKVNAYRAVCEALGVVSVPEGSTSEMNLWPSPAHDVVNMITPFENGVVGITVTDIVGRVIEKRTASSNALVTFDSSAWPSGVYAVCSVQGSRMINVRMVKQ